ncbi:hypothetical protein [Helicobacter salomonis]|uniref:hypothetical protein n=1 Tax=Helicobacter salomonis TaxID=56878 RepID=UPI000CF0140C|nr:hypothetical protein [Helicobacter salomonis]
MKTRVGIYGCMALGALLLGCAHTQSRDQLPRFHASYYAKQNQQADKYAKDIIAKDTKQLNTPLWQLQDGVNEFMMGNYKGSLEVLDQANKVFDTHYRSLEKGIAKLGAATYGSATNIPYEGHMYEWELTNYYMALDYAFMGNLQDARVEFNRTLDRQRRVKEVYTKEIQKHLDKMNADAKQKDAGKLQSMTASLSEFDRQLSSRYSNLKQLEAYDGFINPLVSYVAGLFYGVNGDHGKSVDSLKEAYAISKAPLIAQDIKRFEKHSTDKMTWVIIEDGAQPTLEEYKNATFNYALPLLKQGKNFHTNFELSTGGKNQRFEILSHFDGVVQAEYQKTLPAIKTRAITSAILKTGTEVALKTAGEMAPGYGGLAAGLAGSIMHATNKATTAADTRSSTIFPNTVWVASLENKSARASSFSVSIDTWSKRFTLTTCNANMRKQDNQVCNNTNNIIFIRSFEGSNQNIKVLSF